MPTSFFFHFVFVKLVYLDSFNQQKCLSYGTNWLRLFYLGRNSMERTTLMFLSSGNSNKVLTTQKNIAKTIVKKSAMGESFTLFAIIQNSKPVNVLQNFESTNAKQSTLIKINDLSVVANEYDYSDVATKYSQLVAGIQNTSDKFLVVFTDSESVQDLDYDYVKSLRKESTNLLFVIIGELTTEERKTLTYLDIDPSEILNVDVGSTISPADIQKALRKGNLPSVSNVLS